MERSETSDSPGRLLESHRQPHSHDGNERPGGSSQHTHQLQVTTRPRG